MMLSLEIWHVVSLLLTLAGGFWGMAKLLGAQAQKDLDNRFDTLNKRLDGMANAARDKEDASQRQHRENQERLLQLERSFLESKADMALHYVRREDYIRGQSVIEAKLDGLAVRVDNAQLRAREK